MTATLILSLLTVVAVRWMFKQERTRKVKSRITKDQQASLEAIGLEAGGIATVGTKVGGLATATARKHFLRLPKVAHAHLDNAALSEVAGGPKEQEIAVIWVAAFIFGAAAGFAFAGAAGATLGAIGGIVAPVIVMYLRRGERERRFTIALPDFLESVARSLRSGSSLTQATVEAIDGPPDLPWPLPQELAAVKTGLKSGKPFGQVLESWRQQHPQRATNLAVAAMSLGAGVGGERARAIDGVAHTLREQASQRLELQVSSTQARISAMVIAGLPLMFLLLSDAIGAGSAKFLLETPFGVMCLVAGMLLNALGALWMRKIIQQVPI